MKKMLGFMCLLLMAGVLSTACFGIAQAGPGETYQKFVTNKAFSKSE